MKFTKMQGLGNDYVYINCFEETVEDPCGLAIKLSERHFGIGSDGLILICPSDIADFKMDMYNADGSRSEMCGNGIRCVGKYVYDKKLTDKNEITIETGAGIKRLTLEVCDGVASLITVDMGEPILQSAEIPVIYDEDSFIAQPVKIENETLTVTCVSMGNPHAIIFMDDISDFDIERIGTMVENHEIFPKRTNVEFIQVVDEKTLNMRVWERGSGETLACGTGACASVVAGVLNGKCSRETTVNLLGGKLDIRWDEDNNHVYMKGTANFVFEGTLL